jgi:hypothetical protein
MPAEGMRVRGTAKELDGIKKHLGTRLVQEGIPGSSLRHPVSRMLIVVIDVRANHTHGVPLTSISDIAVNFANCVKFNVALWGGDTGSVGQLTVH